MRRTIEECESSFIDTISSTKCLLLTTVGSCQLKKATREQIDWRNIYGNPLPFVLFDEDGVQWLPCLAIPRRIE